MDRRQAKKSSPVVTTGGAGTPKVKEEDVVRRNLLESLNSAVADAKLSEASTGSAVGSTEPPVAPLPSSSLVSQDGDRQAGRSNTELESTSQEQLDEASRHQEEGLSRLQELVHSQGCLGEAPSLGGDGGGSTGTLQQDPLLLSLFTDLNDDTAEYQDAVPSTDGAGGEVVVVGEILGQEHFAGQSLYSGTQEVKQASSRSDEPGEGGSKPAEEVTMRRPKFQLAAHFDS